MPINAYQVTASRQTLTIHYKDPSFGDSTECATEYDLCEYTAQRVTKTGRKQFRSITTAQWRAVCRDIFASKSCDVMQMRKCIARYASELAVEIFLDEFEKFALKYAKTDPKRCGIKLEDAPEFARSRKQMLAGELKSYALQTPAPQTLDEFANRFTYINRFTLDEFARAIAA